MAGCPAPPLVPHIRAPASAFALAERVEQDGLDMGAGALGDKAEQESSLTQAQASLLDMSDAADGSASTPVSASAAGAPRASGSGGGTAGLDDLLSLEGSGPAPAGGPPLPPAAPAVGSATDLLGDLMGGPAAPAGGTAAPAPSAAAGVPALAGGGLGGLEDLLGGLGGSSAGAAAAPAAPSRGAGVELLPQPQLTPQEFQQSWAAWTPSQRTFNQQLSSAAIAGVEANGFKVGRGVRTSRFSAAKFLG